jgi:DNA-binding NarL/FixJ family response regulator
MAILQSGVLVLEYHCDVLDQISWSGILTTIRILLVDDHVIVREGLRRLIESEQGLQIVGEAQDGREAIELADKARPEVVLMDISMERLNGLEAMHQILRQHPEIKVVVLSIHNEAAYVSAALRAGAGAYVLKTSAFDELCEAIKQALRGETYLSKALPPNALEGYRADVEMDYTQNQYACLTPRQREVLQLLTEGRTRREIAEHLRISPKTVSRHREDVMHALGIEDDAALVKFALRVGIIEG